VLSDLNRPVVEATLPVVGEHIGEIAQRFYRHMFAEHPELLDGTFNRGNQARGEQQQALAGPSPPSRAAWSRPRTGRRRTCSLGSRTSTPRSASERSSTRSCTTT
jgi:hypothetical protein